MSKLRYISVIIAVVLSLQGYGFEDYTSHADFPTASLSSPNGSTMSSHRVSLASSSSSFRSSVSGVYGGVTTMDGYVPGGPRRNGWEPPMEAPVGDGWDVYCFMAVLAMAYTFFRYKTILPDKEK